MNKLVLALAAAAALAGCSATPRVGDPLTLRGTLVLKGSAPRTTQVLVRSPSEQWELQQVSPAQSAPLQNRQVEATGVVTRAPGDGFLPPALRVTALRAAP